MHFLCLHGSRTNSKVFEMQSLPIRDALGEDHTYDFVEGCCASEITADSMEKATSTGGFFYADLDDVDGSCVNALKDLESYAIDNGPFDGVLGYCEGAAWAAALIIYRSLTGQSGLFQCAVLFAAPPPQDALAIVVEAMKQARPTNPNQHQQHLPSESSGLNGNAPLASATPDLQTLYKGAELIHIPTAHIYGANDTEHPQCGPPFRQACRSDVREEFVHSCQHRLPGASASEDIAGVVRAIRRTVQRASESSA